MRATAMLLTLLTSMASLGCATGEDHDTPVTVAKGDFGGPLAVAGDHVYTFSLGELVRIDTASGTPAHADVIAPNNQVNPGGKPIADADAVYFLGAGSPSIHRVATDGFQISPVFEASSGFIPNNALAQDAENLYFGYMLDDGSQAGIYTVPKTGGAPSLAISLDKGTLEDLDGLVVVGDRLLWLDEQLGVVLSVPKTGGKPTDLIVDDAFINGFTVIGDWVHCLATSSDSSGQRVAKVSLDGDRLVTIYEPSGDQDRVYTNFTGDGHEVFFSTEYGSRLLHYSDAVPVPEVRLQGDTSAEPGDAPEIMSFDFIAVADGQVYWRDGFNREIRRVPAQ